MVDFGTDVDCVLDLDPMFTAVSGQLAVGQAIARRLSTVNGAWFADLDFGFSLLERLNDSQDVGALSEIATGCQREAIKDERVSSARATVTFNESTATLTVDLTLVTSAGPFRLVLAVSDVTVEILRLDAA